MRISDGSADVCSSDLAEQVAGDARHQSHAQQDGKDEQDDERKPDRERRKNAVPPFTPEQRNDNRGHDHRQEGSQPRRHGEDGDEHGRSEEHTSELQSLMRNSYAVFFLKTKNKQTNTNTP